MCLKHLNSESLANRIKEKALSLGFEACGIAKVEPVPEKEQAYVDKWVREGMNAQMAYMERNRELRYNPSLLVENARSVIVVALNYYTDLSLPEGAPIFAKYAYGKDYHFIVKDLLNQLLEYIKALVPQVTGRSFTDSAPVMERYWAWKAGLGWQGKNTQFILPHKGSFFFLGELFVDIDLPEDIPLEKEYCGNCSRCMEACPTKALSEPYCLDSRRCLSYQTIENRGEIPQDLIPYIYQTTAYGCDLCQEACPHNRFSIPHHCSPLFPNSDFLEKTPEEWRNMDKSTFKRFFKNSAVQRAGYEKLKDNIRLFYGEEDV